DSCVSPKGDLVVALHSGGPDWGSGPEGKGKLYKISYTGRDVPQPVLAWPQNSRELHVAFDRPLEPRLLNDLAKNVAIEYGRYVAAGDRFERHRPGYQVVQDQLAAPRYDLAVHGVQVTGDRRTLIVATDPQVEAVNYALTLPQIDFRYDLSGVEAASQSKSTAPRTGRAPPSHLRLSPEMTAR